MLVSVQETVLAPVIHTYMKSNGPCSYLCSVELWSSDVGDY